MARQISSILRIISVAMLVTVLMCNSIESLRSRFYDDPYSSSYDRPYSGGRTGERAIVTVAGARNTYDGRAPSKIALDDRYGGLPYGRYDRLDAGRGRQPFYPGNFGGLMGGYGGLMGGYGGYGPNSR